VLVEQAAAYSGVSDDELTSRRIAEQEAQLDILTEKTRCPRLGCVEQRRLGAAGIEAS
jgi:hypothetical protein